MPEPKGTANVGLIQKTKAAVEAVLVGLVSSHTHPSSGVANPDSRVVTATTTELTTDGLIVCNKAASMTVNLLAATGSNRMRQISSINDGPVTVIPNGADTIDGEVSQIIYKNSCMDIKDYAAGKWVII
jgi:hypothetical protein